MAQLHLDATVTNGSTNVTLPGDVRSEIKPGDYFKLVGVVGVYEIASATLSGNDTEITLTAPYVGDSGTYPALIHRDFTERGYPLIYAGDLDVPDILRRWALQMDGEVTHAEDVAGEAVAAHVAQPDPHPQYTTAAEAAAAAPVQSVVGRTGAVTAQQLAEALRPMLGVQIVNLLPDSGRFAGRINPLSTQITAAFEPSPFFSPYNGATIASGGKFIFNNSTFGGTGGALTQDVQDLLAAMGRVDGAARHGVEFYIATITAGGGTSSPTIGADGVTRYLVTTNNNRAVLGADGFVRCAMWMRVVSGSVHIDATHYINGVSREPGGVLPAGWQHVLVEWFKTNGYDNGFPRMFAVPGSVIQIACPIVVAGRVFVGIHTAPVATINEASS